MAPASVFTETELPLTEATVPMTRLEAGAWAKTPDADRTTDMKESAAATAYALTVRLIFIPWYLVGTLSDSTGRRG
jgi:hypothetical protein